jgi:hypothetical protein
MEWLTAEGETPRRLEALVKLRSSATVRNTESALRSFTAICEFYSQPLVHLWVFSNASFAFSLVLEGTTSKDEATLLVPYSDPGVYRF